MRDLHRQRAAVFKELLDNGELVNVTLESEDGARFGAHIELLASVCPYFRPFVQSADSNPDRVRPIQTIRVPGLGKDVLADVLQFVYTGSVCLREDKVSSLADAGETLGMPGVVRLCKRFLVSNLSAKNCVERYRFAGRYHYDDLKATAKNYILAHFEEVLPWKPGFLELDAEDLASVLGEDTLNVREEETVFDAVVKWVEADVVSRSPHLANLLRCVRMGLCSFKFFEEKIWPSELITQSSEECQVVLFQASQLFADLQNGDSPQVVFDAHHPFLRPRVPFHLVFVMGGWSAGSATNVMETYDSKTRRWFLSLNSDSIPRAYHGMLWHQGHVYVIGGFDGNQCFNSVRRFHPASHSWEERGCMHVQRCYVSVAAVGEHVYALGGYDGHRRNRSCERYDTRRNQWNFIADMHHVRSDASADSLDGKVYIVGGFNGSQVLDSAECYDPESNEWTLITRMMTPRSGVKTVALRGHIYAAGGFNGTNRLASVERYDRFTKLWTFVTPMLGPRSNFATAVVEDKMYAIGGFNGLSTISTAEMYDPSNNSWQQVTDLNLNRSALSACTVSDIPTANEYSFLGNVLYQPTV